MKRLYNITKPIIGITGGIASGKSSFSKFIEKQGEQVICADSIIKEIYKKNETISFIKSNSPQSINKNGTIDFSDLREKAFNMPNFRSMLENFLHPQIEELFLKMINLKNPRVFYDVPLLFEKNMQNNFDCIILVKVSEKIQKDRLRNRDNLNDDLIEKIIASQMHFSEKENNSKYIVENNNGLIQLETEAKKILNKIKLQFP